MKSGSSEGGRMVCRITRKRAASVSVAEDIEMPSD